MNLLIGLYFTTKLFTIGESSVKDSLTKCDSIFQIVSGDSKFSIWNDTHIPEEYCSCIGAKMAMRDMDQDIQKYHEFGTFNEMNKGKYCFLKKHNFNIDFYPTDVKNEKVNCYTESYNAVVLENLSNAIKQDVKLILQSLECPIDMETTVQNHIINWMKSKTYDLEYLNDSLVKFTFNPVDFYKTGDAIIKIMTFTIGGVKTKLTNPSINVFSTESVKLELELLNSGKIFLMFRAKLNRAPTGYENCFCEENLTQTYSYTIPIRIR